MCGIDTGCGKSKRTKDITLVKPLPNRNAFEVIDDIERWHPDWSGKVTDPVNAKFVQAAVNRIRENEQVRSYNCD